MLLNDLMKQFNESVETGPKFTGYWKAKDAGTPGKKMVGGESVSNEEANPTDKITMDIPLFIRMLEYAKEDAKTDMDLHDLSERAIELMKSHEHLSMENYDSLVGGQATGGEQPVDEFKNTAQYGDDSGKNINHEIFLLLKSGATVYSGAAGRVGQVISANNDGVTIKTKRGRGFTSFNSGDEVKIEKVEGRPNHYRIMNEMTEAISDNSLKDFLPPFTANGLWVSDRRGNSVLEVTRHGKVAQDVANALNKYASNQTNENKIKGKDGKACWKGYRYAGTENGKDKCVPVKKSK